MSKDRLIEQYSGAGAAGYDDRRAGTDRFRQEVVAFDRLFTRCAPASVIDCPFGTGRWLAQYEKVPGPVLGIDLSEAMLAEARKKIDPASGRAIRLEQGSIFDTAIFERASAQGVDLAVCIRFLNWVDMNGVEKALRNLARARPRKLIVGVSVVPDEWPAWRALWARVRLAWINLPQSVRGKPVPYVHPQREVLAQFVALGWRVEAVEPIFADGCRTNAFYLLAGPDT